MNSNSSVSKQLEVFSQSDPSVGFEEPFGAVGLPLLEETGCYTSSFTVQDEKFRSETASLVPVYEEIIDKYKLEFIDKFYQVLNESEFEVGYRSNAEDYVEVIFNNFGSLAREWVNTVFIDNFSNSFVACSILKVIAHFKYERIYPQGVTMATAALRHKSDEVVDCAIRCFENWEEPSSVAILRSISLPVGWLSDYLKEVVANLEESA